MIRNRIDRLFERFRRTGNARLLAQVFDRTAPELWRVAAHLCRDRHTAEDAVQATFLGAIEAQRDWDASRPLVPWLLGLLANRVREQRRRQQRAPDAARLERAGERDPADVAADREVSATLAAALQQIDEPYRAALERHLVHGQAAHEIAAELAVPAGTVRMRLHRGLDRLRQKLPPGLAVSGAAVLPLRPESLAAMRSVVLGAVPGGAAVVGSGHVGSFVIGVFLMSKVFWTVLASGVVLLSAWWAWPAASAVEPLPERVAAAEPARPPASVPPPADEPANAAASTAGPERVVIESAAPAGTKGWVRVVLRNAGNGAPVPGADLEVRDGLAERPPEAGPGPAVTSREHAARTFTTDSDADGVCTLHLQPGWATLSLPDLGVRRSLEVTPGGEQELRIDVPVRFTADVRVVDAVGRPVADARLVGSTGRDAFGLAALEFGRTGADGRCRVPTLVDVLRLRAHAPGYAASASIELDPHSPSATLRLADGPAEVSGTIVDAQGVAVAGCTVAFQPLPRRRGEVAPILVFADDAGHFVCGDVPPGRCLVVAVRLLGDGSSRLVEQEVLVQSGGNAFVALRFGAGAALDVRLLGADGAPVVAAEVVLSLQHDGLGDFARVATVVVTTDAGGEGVVRDLLPGRWRAQILHEGLVQRELVLAARQVGSLEHVFGAGTALAVRVVDRQGQPVAGWLVTLAVGARERRERSDTEGRVRFADLAGEVGELRVAPDEAASPQVTREVPFGGEVVVTVDPLAHGAAALRGVLAPGAGVGLADLQVLLVRASPAEAAPPLVVAFDAASGSFTADRLAAGEYRLLVMGSRSYETLAVRERIAVPASGVVDLGTVAVGTGRVVVAATLPDGTGVENPIVGVGLHVASRFTPLNVRADGRAALPEGSYALLVWGESIVPAEVTVHVRIGAETVTRLSVQRAAPVTLRLDELEPGVRVASLSVRGGNAAPIDLMLELRRGAAVVRGFAPGQHEVALDDLRGGRYSAAFTVGDDLAPQEVRLRRAP